MECAAMDRHHRGRRSRGRADGYARRAGKYPVILSYGPYGKWLRDLYTISGGACRAAPDVVAIDEQYQKWEAWGGLIREVVPDG